MAAAATPPPSAGATTPTGSAPTFRMAKTPPKHKTHARYLADVNDALDDVDHYASVKDNRGFARAVQQGLRTFQRELSGVSQCFDQHAHALEIHHESLYNAHMTFKQTNSKVEKMDLDVKFDLGKLYVAVSPVEGHAISCLLYTSPSPRDKRQSRMPSSA